MIIIDCEAGRIGEMWWINSEPGTPIERSHEFVPGIHIRRRHLRLSLEPIDE